MIGDLECGASNLGKTLTLMEMEKEVVHEVFRPDDRPLLASRSSTAAFCTLREGSRNPAKSTNTGINQPSGPE